MNGKKLCLAAIVFVGVGLVLTALGFDSHTTEALPFGVVTLLVGFGLAFPAAKAVAQALRVEPEVTPFSSVDGALRPSGPAVAIRCASCGSTAPVSLAEPTHVQCAHCGVRSALPEVTAQALAKAAEDLQKRDQAEGRASALVASLPRRHGALRRRLWVVTATLTGVASAIALGSWLLRMEEDTWHGWFLFGTLAAPVTLVIGLFFALLVPKVAGRVVVRWAALQLPGVEGLRCRVCGGDLPRVAAPVLSCTWCRSDNLAGPEVHALVAKSAAHAGHVLRSLSSKVARADELATFVLQVAPVLTLVFWFGIGAAAGGVGYRWLGEKQIEAPQARFAVVRVPEGACLARVWSRRAGGYKLQFTWSRVLNLSAAELAKVVEPDIPTAGLVGRSFAGQGTIARVYSEVRQPGRVFAEAEGSGKSLYPGTQLLCLP